MNLSIFTSRVIIVGDFNVSHRIIDTCDPGKDLNVNKQTKVSQIEFY